MKDEIQKAIGAHGMWKSRLKLAIDSGKSDATPETVRGDKACAFGKWLYGPTITPQNKSSAVFKKVVTLHADFHKAAGEILALALAGKKNEAARLIGPDSKYARVSAELTQTMMQWLKEAS